MKSEIETVLTNARDALQTLLDQQGGLVNEKNNMVYNVTGLIESIDEVLKEIQNK
jgi:uncharacterized membrane-anchored protein YitT (DUF2179 family)